MAAISLSPEDKEFLEKCEELFKDRYTEKDEEFMKVHDAESPTPPIMETWWVPQNSGRRNDRRFNNRNHPYERQNDRKSGYENERRSGYDNRRSGYNDYENDRGHGYRNRRYN